MLALEGVCEEGGEGFCALNCFSSAGRRLDWREVVLGVLLNCWCCRSNSSCSCADSKSTLATEARKPSSSSNEDHCRYTAPKSQFM